MKVVSNAYKEAIRSPSRELMESRIVVIAPQDIIITDENIESIEIDNGILSSENFTIGGGIASSISVSINNYDEKYSGINFEGKLMEVFFKVQLADGTWEEVFYNNFWIEECKKTGKNIKLEGFDKLATDILDSKYSSTLTFPAKVSDVVYDMRRLAVDFGYNLKNNTYSFNDLMIPQKPQGSFRQVLTDVATIAGGFLVCLSGLVDIYVLNDTDIEITNDNSFETTVSNSFTNVTGVNINGYEVGDSTGNVLNQEVALLNGISEGYLEAIAVNMLNYYKTTQYVGYNSEWQGDFAMEVCDKIKVYDEKDVAHISIVTNNKINYNGGLKATTEAKISKKKVESKSAQTQKAETKIIESNMGIYAYKNETPIQVTSGVISEACVLDYETSSNANLLLFVSMQLDTAAQATAECNIFLDDIECDFKPKTSISSFGILSFTYPILKVTGNSKHKLTLKLLTNSDVTVNANQLQVALFGQKVVGGISPDVPIPSVPTWSQGANMPTSKYGAMGVLQNNKIYVAGGVVSSATSKLEIYSISSDVWTQGATMPNAVSETASVLYNNNMYVIGGENYGSKDFIQEYNISSNTWSILNTTTPVKIERCTAQVYNDNMYVIGGCVRPSWDKYNTVYIYNFTSNVWTQGATMPKAIDFIQSTVCNGKIYVFGYNIFYIYNIDTNSWSIGSTLAINDAHCYGCWLYGNIIYAMFNNVVYSYNPNTNTWSGALTTLERNHADNSLILGNGNISYIIGGILGGSCNFVDILTLP